MTAAPENLEEGKETINPEKWRESTQPLLLKHVPVADNAKTVYDHIPFHALGSGRIFNGYEGLTDWIIAQKSVVIDGYGGVFYEDVYQQIQGALAERGIVVNWFFTADYLKPEMETEELVSPFLSHAADVWGTKTSLQLKDFFEDGISALVPDQEYELNIILGIGAALSHWDAPVVYFDIPKNEIQYRMRAEAITNLGKTSAEAPFAMYKRFYFVDWVVLDKHRNQLLDKIAVVADGQWFQDVNWMFKKDLAEGLRQMARTVFRVRPWFEKGSWGGQWMKQHIGGLNNAEVNYAWSFELISPENGLVLESDRQLLEVSFDFLMLFAYREVLGRRAEEFGPYFPIRFDFLDTFDGGNLSVQCHPSLKYIQENFGEAITQDETYYILDCKPGARVYLGFQEDIDPAVFRTALEESQAKSEKLEVEKYVQSFPAHKHDLFLIPNGTIHSSGVNNMVLEISATPYIFTFKMYDWLALDLNGNPRPINIDHAFNNLRFERKGAVVEQEHIAHPVVTAQGADWQLVHLPTHRDHFYDVHRIEFDTEVTVDTLDSCHVLMLVEGSRITLKVDGVEQDFAYAETFVIPAAAKSYQLINKGTERAKVIKSFLKNQ
jgi:mannose-6-phosphate isomerase class I